MKNIKVKYIFEVTKTISIHEDDCPKHLEQEEYENEQIEFAGNDLEFNLDGHVSWHFQRLD